MTTTDRKLSISQALPSKDEKKKDYDSDDELTILPSQIRFYDTIKHFREEIDEEEKSIAQSEGTLTRKLPREYSFPKSLSAEDRKVIHFLAKKFGLTSASSGKGKERVVTIYYPLGKESQQEALSKSMKKKFVKHWSIQMPLLESPYFEYYIELYDEMFETRRKMRLFKEDVKSIEKDHYAEYIGKHYKAIKNELVQKISSSEAFQVLLSKETELLNHYSIPENNSFKRVIDRDIWDARNHGRYFISIDIRNARFNALRYHDPELVCNCKTWKELLEKFGLYSPSLHESKYWRSTVFESLCGELQAKIIGWILFQIADGLLEADYFHIKEFVSFCDVDEMLLFTTKETWKRDCTRISKFLQEKFPELASILRIEPFQLTQMSRDEQFFLKEVLQTRKGVSTSSSTIKRTNLGKKIQIKCEPEFWPQCYKYYKGWDVDEKDRKVLFKGRHGEYIATLDGNVFD